MKVSTIDISSYTGKYKIRIRQTTGYATYGYGGSSTTATIGNLVLY